MQHKANPLTRTPIIIICALIACFLWGSAFPSIKIGYHMFQIDSADTASQMLFAGCRFFLAGVLVVIIGSISARKILIPRKSSIGPIFLLSLFQTIGQYVFFYIGLSNISGVKSSIITAANTFICVLFACLLFRSEKLTLPKMLGCVIGFAGVVIINLAGGSSIDFTFSLTGEGFILFSTTSGALAAPLIKHFSKWENPLILSGYQFAVGGLVLAIVGLATGGRLTVWSPASCLLLFYMGCISAVAYSLWSLLLKHNPVSKISVFSFINPVVGVILSALLLGEQNQAFSIYGLLSMILVTIGIIVVYRIGNKPQPISES